MAEPGHDTLRIYRRLLLEARPYWAPIVLLSGCVGFGDGLREAARSDLEALAADRGPILTAVVALDRRWQALDMSGNSECLERFNAIRHTIQARFDREQEAQQGRVLELEERVDFAERMLARQRDLPGLGAGEQR